MISTEAVDRAVETMHQKRAVETGAGLSVVAPIRAVKRHRKTSVIPPESPACSGLQLHPNSIPVLRLFRNMKYPRFIRVSSPSDACSVRVTP